LRSSAFDEDFAYSHWKVFNSATVAEAKSDLIRGFLKLRINTQIYGESHAAVPVVVA
jgi:hypothetical protein